MLELRAPLGRDAPLDAPGAAAALAMTGPGRGWRGWLVAGLVTAGVAAGVGMLALLRIPADATDAELAAELGRRYGGMRRLRFAGEPEISVAEWQARPQDRPAVLVDVREPHERRVSMLPGAISREEFERNSARYRAWVVVPYCTIGLRSGLYTRTLRQQGFEARNLAGSALAWAHAGLPFEADGAATRRVHVYSADWNLLPRGYEPVVSAPPPLPARAAAAAGVAP